MCSSVYRLPCQKQWLIELILDIDHDIPIGSDVENGPWEQPINPDHLKHWS